MAIPGSKWWIITVCVIGILVLLYLFGRKTVHTELTIEADPAEIWAELMNVPGIFTFDLKYMLEPAAQGTRFTIHEDFRGIAVLFWDASWLETAYQESAKELRDRIFQKKTEKTIK